MASDQPKGISSAELASISSHNSNHSAPSSYGAGGGSDTGMGMSQMTGQNAIDGIFHSSNLDGMIVQGEVGGNVIPKGGVWSKKLAEFSAGNLAIVGGIESMNELAHGIQGEKMMLQHVAPGEQLNMAKGMSGLGPEVANKGLGQQGGH